MKIRNFVIIWLSRIILNLVSPDNKLIFCKLENFEKKKISTQLHRELNQTFLKENLLPKFTNIYIYICKYIYLLIYMYISAPRTPCLVYQIISNKCINK